MFAGMGPVAGMMGNGVKEMFSLFLRHFLIPLETNFLRRIVLRHVVRTPIHR
jgi:hypothetical protein